MRDQLEQFGITKEVMEKAMAAMVKDIAPQAAESGTSVGALLKGWSEPISSAYFFGYTSAVLAGKEGEELTSQARLSIVYAFGKSTDPKLRELAAELRKAAAGRAWAEINAQTRALGELPSFVAHTCTECPAGTDGAVYREDRPTPEGETYERWRCGVCGKAASLSHFDLGDNEETAFRGDVLGYVTKGNDVK